MSLYLKAVCILTRGIYAALREPLKLVVVVAVPLGTGWLLRLAFPTMLNPASLLGQPAYAPINWASVWFAGILCDIFILALLALIHGVVRLWRDALREAQRIRNRPPLACPPK
ncbi:hypothetical protein [Acidithiobacillus ferrivorans]|nr:hypothetical protein [Acidithiobacillus ferrivorans]